ncbi:MAG: hypothetical protein ACYTEK_15405 [Planctomycetota bacterium]
MSILRFALSPLFDRLCQNPVPIPRYFQRFIPEQGLQRTVCHYVAGMTDRLCLKMLNEIQPPPPDNS